MFNIRKACQLTCLLTILTFVFVFKANVELWCPFGGVETLYSLISEGNLVCALASSNLIMLIGILFLTLLFKRVFCSYLCPLGTISELFFKLGRKLKLPEVTVPEKADKFLSLFKFVSLAFILWLTVKTGELAFRGFDPCYALISRHGKDITIVAYIVSGIFILASMIFKLPFCRWFCPFAPVLNLFSKAGITKVKINQSQCLECGKCNKACPMQIAVSKFKEISHGRCTNCLECVDACPVKEQTPIALTTLSGSSFKHIRYAMIALIACALGLTFLAGCLFDFPSYTASRNELKGANQAVLELEVSNITCNGSAKSFRDFLFREDDSKVKGPLLLEVYTSLDWAKVKIKYDSKTTSPSELKNAIIESRFDPVSKCWLDSPFEIKGYDILDDI